MNPDDPDLRSLVASGYFVQYLGRTYLLGCEPVEARRAPMVHERAFLMISGPLDGGGINLNCQAERYVGFTGVRWFAYIRLGPLYRMTYLGSVETREAADGLGLGI